MEKPNIKLRINGKEKRFKAPKFISTYVLLQALDLEKELLKDDVDLPIIFEKCLPLICEVYGNQFTLLQLQKSVDMREVIPLTQSVIDYVIKNIQVINDLIAIKNEKK